MRGCFIKFMRCFVNMSNCSYLMVKIKFNPILIFIENVFDRK